MKPAVLSLVFLMGVGGAYAQRGGGMRGGGGGGGVARGGGAPRGGAPNVTYPSVGITPYGGIPTTPHGYGSYMFPGTGTPGFGITAGLNTGYSTIDPSFASRLGATIGGWPAYTGSRGRVGRGGMGGTYVVPFGVPIGMPVSNYGYGYGMEQPAVVNATPPVIINQYYTQESVRPVMREYLPDSLPEPPAREQPSSGVTQYGPPARTSAEPRKTIADEKATIHLVALRDDRILALIGYWVEGPDLHYITKSYAKGAVPLTQVDRPLSEKLNRERNVEFELPE